MTNQQTAKKGQSEKSSETWKRHRAYLFWAVVVIIMAVINHNFPSSYMSVFTFMVDVLALYRLLRYDKGFMRVHKAFRTASSVRTAKMTPEQVKAEQAKVEQERVAEKQERTFENQNLNANLKQHR